MIVILFTADASVLIRKINTENLDKKEISTYKLICVPFLRSLWSYVCIKKKTQYIELFDIFKYYNKWSEKYTDDYGIELNEEGKELISIYPLPELIKEAYQRVPLPIRQYWIETGILKPEDFDSVN